MLSLYEILKASKTGIAPDMWTALAGMNWGGKDSGAEVKELTGIPPLSIRSNGTMLLDYLISGNMSQTGTPTPTTPIQPQECGERTGNLFDKDATNVNNGYIDNGYIRSDGSINTNTDYRASEYIRISQNQQYNLYYGTYLNNPSVCFYDSAKNYISGVAYAGQWDVPFTTPQNAEYLRLSFRAIDASKIILNLGSVRLPYENFGYKIPISCGGTTNNVYLGEVQTTRRIRKLVLTGQESWDVNPTTNVFFATINNALGTANVITSVCSHYQAVDNKALYKNVDNYCSCIRANTSVLWIKDTNYDSSSYYVAIGGFKSYLASQYAAGTPVCVWYVLAEPTTGIVNEPLRKIGEYADTLSMEQAGVQIPTLHGNTVIDVQTELKPSEMYIKYQG